MKRYWLIVLVISILLWLLAISVNAQETQPRTYTAEIQTFGARAFYLVLMYSVGNEYIRGFLIDYRPMFMRNRSQHCDRARALVMGLNTETIADVTIRLTNESKQVPHYFVETSTFLIPLSVSRRIEEVERIRVFMCGKSFAIRGELLEQIQGFIWTLYN